MLTHSRRQKFQIVKEHNKLKLVKKFLSNKTSINTNIEFGGARRDRTADLLRARQALSQLSYGPDRWWVWEDLNFRPHPYQGCALTN